MVSLLKMIGEWSPRHCGAVVGVWVLCATILFDSVSVAGDLTELSVTEADGTFTLRIVSLLDAPIDYVYQLIADYRHAYRIDPEITAIEILPSGLPGVVRVRNYSTHWIGPFPFKIEWVGDIVETESGRLEITTLPGLGSFESGSALWEIRPSGERTKVVHQSTLRPNFPIIPVIGSYVVRQYIKNSALDTFNRIECHAQNMRERSLEDFPQQLRVPLKEARDCTQSPHDEMTQSERSDG